MRLLCIIPCLTDATSFYRALGPLGAMKDVRLTINPDVNWATLKQCDAVFMQRPYTKYHLQVLNLAHMSGKKVWIDYDDNLLAVPAHNPKHHIYSSPETEANIVELVRGADAVSVSTEALRSSVLKWDKLKDVSVIPNALDESIMPMAEVSRYQLALWRGSSHHVMDLYKYADDIATIADHYRQWAFEFMGEPHWLAMNVIQGGRSNVFVTPPVDTVQYFKVLRMKAPSVVFVPLEDTPFNAAKSNIAWIEATMAGAVCIAPDWPEWHQDGIYNYSQELYQAMNAVITMTDEERARRVNMSREYILKHLTLTKVNILRYQILGEIES